MSAQTFEVPPRGVCILEGTYQQVKNYICQEGETTTDD